MESIDFDHLCASGDADGLHRGHLAALLRHAGRGLRIGPRRYTPQIACTTRKRIFPMHPSRHPACIRNAVLRLTLILAATGPALAMAQVYKWVDERGVTHYGEKPQAKGAKPVTLVDPTGGPRESADRQKPDTRGPTASKAEPAGEERDFQKRREARLREEAQQQQDRQAQSRQAASDQSRKQAECQRANSDLVVIRRNTTNYTYEQERSARERAARNC